MGWGSIAASSMGLRLKVGAGGGSSEIIYSSMTREKSLGWSPIDLRLSTLRLHRLKSQRLRPKGRKYGVNKNVRFTLYPIREKTWVTVYGSPHLPAILPWNIFTNHRGIYNFTLPPPAPTPSLRPIELQPIEHMSLSHQSINLWDVSLGSLSLETLAYGSSV